VERLADATDPIPLDLDDTLYVKAGSKVEDGRSLGMVPLRRATRRRAGGAEREVWRL
jgi:hypothetical protein